MKDGIKTSEFWVMLIVSNIMIFAKQLGWELDESTLLNITGMVIAYIGARTWAKI